MPLHFGTRLSRTIRASLIATACITLIACGGKSVEEHIAQAQQHIASGDNNTAIIELKSAIQTDPKNAQARFLLGKIYMQSNEFASAEKELTRARDLGYSAAEVIPLLSQAYQRNQTVVGLSTLDTSAVSNNTTAKAQVSFYKLQSFVELDKKPEAYKLIEEIKVLDTDSIYKDLALVYTTILDNDAVGAELQLNNIRKEAPTNRDLLDMLARLYIVQNKRVEAVEVLGEYIKQSPDDLETLFSYTGLLIEVGEMEEAQIHAEKLLEISPNNPLLNQMQAVILASQDDHQGAFAAAEKSISLGNTNPVARLTAGFSAFKLNDFINANKHLSLIAANLPDDHPGLKMLAASQLQLGLSLQASQVLARVDKDASNNPQLYSKLGYELIQDGYIDEAKALIEKTESMSNSNQDLTRIGILKLSVNDLDGILDLEKAAKGAPEDVPTQVILATAYLANRDYAKALTLSETWQQLMPDEPKAYVLEAEAAVATSDYARAQVALEKALQLAPDDPIPNMSLVRILARQKEYPAALARTKKVLALKPAFEPALMMYYVLKKEMDPQQKEVNDIFAYLDKGIAVEPTAAMYILKAIILNSEGQYDQALNVLAQPNAIDLDSSGYWQTKGQALVASDKVNSAQDHYTQWLNAFPNSYDAVIGRLVVHDVKSEFVEGLALIKSKPMLRDQVPIKIMELQFLAQTNDTRAGRNLYNTLSNEVKALPDVEAINAMLLLQESNPKAAVKPAQTAYEQRSNRRNLLTLLKALDGANRPADALVLLNKHVAAKPNDAVANFILAERSMKSTPQKSITIYTQIVEQQPTNFVALNNLAYLLYEQDAFAKAEGYAKQAMAIQPDNAAVVDTLAQIYNAQEQYDEALTLYNRVVSDTMSNEAIFLNYIETLILAENRLLAKRKLESRQWQERNSQQRIAVIKAKYNI
jgi:putative PEP-CTERM system TPR-repeat lipoprotein